MRGDLDSLCTLLLRSVTYTDAEGFRTPANDCLAASFTDLSGSNRGWYPGRGEIRTAVEGLTRLAGILRAA